MIGIEIKKRFCPDNTIGISNYRRRSKNGRVTDSAKRMLAMPVRVAIATNVKGIIDEIQEPSFSTVKSRLLSYGGSIETHRSSIRYIFTIW